MTNEEYAQVIDAFANAVYRAMGAQSPPTDDLIRATGDLLQAFADRATRLVTTPLAILIERADKIERDIGELHLRFDRRQQRYAEIAQILQDLQLQISDDRALLRADLDALSARDARQYAEGMDEIRRGQAAQDKLLDALSERDARQYAESAEDRAQHAARLDRMEAALMAMEQALTALEATLGARRAGDEQR